MLSKTGSRIIASIATLLSFLTVIYISGCSKQGANKYSCEGVVCLNGGYCDSAQCHCPVGYEGANCSIGIADKYVGTWWVRQIIIGTDSLDHLHDTTYFQAFLKYSATPTTFFFDNFNGDPSYNQVLCAIDSPATGPDNFDSSNVFVIDTTSGFSMQYGHYQLLPGGSGTIVDTTITGIYYVRHTNMTVNWENDTVSFTLTPHHL